jgi:hypothetical protein
MSKLPSTEIFLTSHSSPDAVSQVAGGIDLHASISRASLVEILRAENDGAGCRGTGQVVPQRADWRARLLGSAASDFPVCETLGQVTCARLAVVGTACSARVEDEKQPTDTKHVFY